MKMRTGLALLLAVLLLMLPYDTAADTPMASLSAGSGSGLPGATNVAVPVSLASLDGAQVAGLSFDLSFDASRLAVGSVSIGSAGSSAGKFLSWSQPAANRIRVIIFAVNQAVIPDGAVAVVSFNVLAGATPGTSSLTLSSAAASDPGGNPVPVSGSDGSFEVLAPPATNTPLATATQPAVPTSTSTAPSTATSTLAGPSPTSGGPVPTNTTAPTSTRTPTATSASAGPSSTSSGPVATNTTAPTSTRTPTATSASAGPSSTSSGPVVTNTRAPTRTRTPTPTRTPLRVSTITSISGGTPTGVLTSTAAAGGFTGTPESSVEADGTRTVEAATAVEGTASAEFESAVAGTATALAGFEAAIQATATTLAEGDGGPITPDEGDTTASSLPPDWTGILLLGSIALGLIVLGAIAVFVVPWGRKVPSK